MFDVHLVAGRKVLRRTPQINMSNAHRGGLGAVSSGYGTTAINGFGSQIVGGDPAVLLRVGATSGGIASGSLSSLYAIAAGGLRRDRQK